jgi:Methane oxygenase PmoA
MRSLLLLSCLFAGCAAPPPVPEVFTPDGALGARLVAVAHDPAAHADTCKVYHAVHAPDGRLLTKGLGGTHPHHRGLFVGWNQLRVGGGRFDFWHCNRGESQQLVQLLAADQHGRGPGWQVAAIDWRTPSGTTVLHEQRAVRVLPLAAGEHVLDITIVLRATDAEVQLDGDPHHAGCQFRALQQFADRAEPPIRYLRPSTAADGKNDIWTGCAWAAAVLPCEGGPVTVLRCEHLANPPAVWSMRPYGRFGAMSKATIAAGQQLELRYSYVIALGERDAAWCAGTWAALNGR